MLNDGELYDIAQEIQQECHTTVEQCIKLGKKGTSMQDATNVFIFRKLAEMELRIRQLESASFYINNLLND